MKRALSLYFGSWWLPAFVFMCTLLGFACAVVFDISTSSRWQVVAVVSSVLFYLAGIAFLGIIFAAVWNLVQKRLHVGVINTFLILVCGVATIVCVYFLAFVSFFGPSEDGFANSLTIPEGIEISEPDPEFSNSPNVSEPGKVDEFQDTIHKALAIPGSDETAFAPDMPSFRRAATDHTKTFRDYIEASPDWHVFLEQGNQFATRRWSDGEELRDSLHGYISDYTNSNLLFQCRCLICFDRKQWGRYPVQHVKEGQNSVRPDMSRGNNLHESRVMIDCGGVWVEIFEQSRHPERQVTKAVVAALEKEFSEFLKRPEEALAGVRTRSREMAVRLAGKEDKPFRLRVSGQTGTYEVAYSLNAGEPGLVYLKAFEITQGTPLSVYDLRADSETRMAWSADPAERFSAKSEFMIYEGDWGQPYAARFEVWFKPDSGQDERKLAERNYKIEGWMR